MDNGQVFRAHLPNTARNSSQNYCRACYHTLPAGTTVCFVAGANASTSVNCMKCKCPIRVGNWIAVNYVKVNTQPEAPAMAAKSVYRATVITQPSPTTDNPEPYPTILIDNEAYIGTSSQNIRDQIIRKIDSKHDLSILRFRIAVVEFTA